MEQYISVIVFVGGMALGAAIVLFFFTDYIKARGVDEYLAKQEADRKWWIENPTGIKHHTNSMLEMRWPKPEDNNDKS